MLIGVDFSSTPTQRKPVVVAVGLVRGAVVQLQRLERFATHGAFAAWLDAQPAWTGGFDLPFGLPRELVETLGWPTGWSACIDHYARMTRPAIREAFVAFCDARPVGGKFAHRACDGPAGSSPSMKWINPPVAWMLHAGVPLLRGVGAAFPAHEAVAADAPRIALEAYPGLLARELIGRRPYKSDEAAKQTAERLIARKDLVEALEQGRTRLALRLNLTPAQHAALIDDASGDALDAALCLVQAAWGQARPGWGLPANVDPLEGWIVSA
ncbi:DUF429 domain-containing protein [Aquabacterium humicola]|uniref:DUF429 domain-containing protein n=1 Tax=Aquabacterium humicola TaxID=3237377 RepID=UPI00254313B2|nr:DUF429 domain-containing protein [Rubrivivax pictus]